MIGKREKHVVGNRLGREMTRMVVQWYLNMREKLGRQTRQVRPLKCEKAEKAEKKRKSGKAEYPRFPPCGCNQRPPTPRIRSRNTPKVSPTLAEGFTKIQKAFLLLRDGSGVPCAFGGEEQVEQTEQKRNRSGTKAEQKWNESRTDVEAE